MYDLNLNLQLPTPWGGHDIYVYAPTTMAPGGACIEIVQVYRRLTGGATTGKYFGLWDWCQQVRFVVLQAQVTSWTNRYVRTYQGKPMYAVSIVTVNSGSTFGQCWYSHLYDYTLGGWVQLLQACGVPQHGWNATGWTMWESWWLTNGTCPNLPSIRALDIMFYDPQSGTAVPFTNWPADYTNLGPYGTLLARRAVHICQSSARTAGKLLAREHAESLISPRPGRRCVSREGSTYEAARPSL